MGQGLGTHWEIGLVLWVAFPLSLRYHCQVDLARDRNPRLLSPFLTSLQEKAVFSHLWLQCDVLKMHKAQHAGGHGRRVECQGFECLLLERWNSELGLWSLFRPWGTRQRLIRERW